MFRGSLNAGTVPAAVVGSAGCAGWATGGLGWGEGVVGAGWGVGILGGRGGGAEVETGGLSMSMA